MFNSNLWKSIGVVAAAFLLVLLIEWIIKPTGDWTMIFAIVPIMVGGLYWLIRAVDRKKKDPPPPQV